MSSDSSFNIHNALYFVKYPARAAQNSPEGRRRPAGRGLKTSGLRESLKHSFLKHNTRARAFSYTVGYSSFQTQVILKVDEATSCSLSKICIRILLLLSVSRPLLKSLHLLDRPIGYILKFLLSFRFKNMKKFSMIIWNMDEITYL